MVQISKNCLYFIEKIKEFLFYNKVTFKNKLSRFRKVFFSIKIHSFCYLFLYRWKIDRKFIFLLIIQIKTTAKSRKSKLRNICRKFKTCTMGAQKVSYTCFSTDNNNVKQDQSLSRRQFSLMAFNDKNFIRTLSTVRTQYEQEISCQLETYCNVEVNFLWVKRVTSHESRDSL